MKVGMIGWQSSFFLGSGLNVNGYAGEDDCWSHDG